MYRKTNLTKLALAAAALFVSACGGTAGGLIDDDYTGEPIATISGTLTTTNPTAIGGQVSLAMIWLDASLYSLPVEGFPSPEFTCDTPTAPPTTSRFFTYTGWVSQSVALQAQFPLNFSVPINQLPPPRARIDLTGEGMSAGEMALGFLVAYVDSNANGVLDPPSLTQLGDEILAIGSDYGVVYLDGTYDPAAGFIADLDGPVPHGLSILVKDPVSNRYMPSSPSTPVALQIGSSDPLFAVLKRTMCTTTEFRYVFDVAEPPGATRSCGDRSYTWLSYVEDSNLCVSVLAAGRSCLAPNDPIPANWPCN